ncbi:MAG: DNA topoisomerase 4 subunit A [Clostridiales bacterium]|nr:DNA topoisomerase 4 subunit A [Clostridiales bacterium]
MASKKTAAARPLGRIIERPLEEVMHSSMIPYAEYVILERALPRVEDGLKPVQRRILYSMMELGITPDKPHRKCARIVGDTLGKYHPHGDTSVYNALVRMAQDFNMSVPLVDGHGNFGSIDGDSAAAMRYTEARMTPAALELLRDIEKETVSFSLNFDDSQKEPDMLPGRFPNLLVNGAQGIAVGLSTNIPTHNMCEAIDGVIAMLKKPKITLSEMMAHIKGPDFPTGGYCTAGEDLVKAYETGKGAVQLRAKTEIEQDKNGKSRIVISELPYQVEKAGLLSKILKLCEERKGILSYVSDIRDESDKTGMRAVIEVKKGGDVNKILNYLYRYSDLQISFNFNMVAIVEGKPKLLGLLDMCRYYAEYQKDVVLKRTNYELFEAERREHILAGLILAALNIDEVIRIIRSSESPQVARLNLMEAFELTSEQAQAILDMRLRRLTSLEVIALRKEHAEVEALIEELRAIVEDEKKLIALLCKELREIKNKYGNPRRTTLVEGLSIQTVQVQEAAPSESCDVIFTAKGYIKRLDKKANQKTDDAPEEATIIASRTDDKLLLFTNKGNMLLLPVSSIPAGKLKDRGASLTSLISGLDKDETVVSLLSQAENTGDLLFITKLGMVKRTAAEEYKTTRTKLAACGLKGKDALLMVIPADKGELSLISVGGFAIRFDAASIPAQGRTAGGVKCMNLAEEDRILTAGIFKGDDTLVLVTERGYGKRMLTGEIEVQNRNGKGQKIFGFDKDGVYGTQLAGAHIADLNDTIVIHQENGDATPVSAAEMPLETKQGKGVPLVLALFDNIVNKTVKQLLNR